MAELVRGQEDIEVNLGVTTTNFAYPNTLWNEQIEEMVKQVYRTARHAQYCGTAQYVTRETNPYRLPAMNVSYLLPFDDFKRLVLRTDPEFEYYPECRD